MESIVKYISAMFGWMLVGLSFFVTSETLLRKIFNFSLQGADELGGYALAVTSSLGFLVALIDRAHIRIDIFHNMFHHTIQAVMNWLSIMTLALVGVFFTYVGWIVVSETFAYGSTAATPWATPLIWPQGVWYASLVLFALTSFGLLTRATWLSLRRQESLLVKEFGPKGAVQELTEELKQNHERSADQ